MVIILRCVLGFDGEEGCRLTDVLEIFSHLLRATSKEVITKVPQEGVTHSKGTHLSQDPKLFMCTFAVCVGLCSWEEH